MRRSPLLAVAAVTLAAACSAGLGSRSGSAPSGLPGPDRPNNSADRSGSSRAPAGGVTVIAAGDIACRDGCADAATATVAAAQHPQLILALGDEQYESGSYADFLDSYDRTWGRFASITRPVPGNHEYAGGSAPGYYRDFGRAAGDPRHGWYSFDIGGWHLVALSSRCGGAGVGGCGPGSPQVRWLAADLAASQARCTLAYWHQPRFSSGLHGSDPAYDAFWRTLYAARAELVLSSHDHDYERFAPLDPTQRMDADRGIRQFVVGTGGKTRYPILFPRRGSEVRLDSAYGVLELTLRPGTYDWRFVTVSGTVADSGSERCH